MRVDIIAGFYSYGQSAHNVESFPERMLGPFLIADIGAHKLYGQTYRTLWPMSTPKWESESQSYYGKHCRRFCFKVVDSSHLSTVAILSIAKVVSVNVRSGRFLQTGKLWSCVVYTRDEDLTKPLTVVCRQSCLCRR